MTVLFYKLYHFRVKYSHTLEERYRVNKLTYSHFESQNQLTRIKPVDFEYFIRI